MNVTSSVIRPIVGQDRISQLIDQLTRKGLLSMVVKDQNIYLSVLGRKVIKHFNI